MSQFHEIGLLIDFDRTIFDTQSMADDLLVQLKDQGLISHEDIQTIDRDMNSPQFNSMNLMTRLEGHDPTVTSKNILDASEKLVTNYDFDDVSTLNGLARQIMIITTASGDKSWQDLKLGMSPFAKDKEAAVLSINKGKYIRSRLDPSSDGSYGLLGHFNGESFENFILVDDRLEALEPIVGVSGLQGVLLQRSSAPEKYALSTQQREVASASGLIVIESLSELEELDIWQFQRQ